jgi:oligopeptide transport system substrate-binding protein
MKKVLAIVVALLMTVGMAACSPGATTTASAVPTVAATATPTPAPTVEPTPAPPTVLNVYAATEPESIDPAKIAWSHEFTLVYHAFDGLMRWDATVPGSVPVLGDAKEITWDATKTKATVTLRDDIFWSDGQPVKAQDYEYAWKRHADANLATAYGSTMVEFFKGGLDAYNAVQKGIDDGTALTGDALQAAKDLMQIKATGDKTLTFELANPCPFFDFILAFGTMVPVRKDIIETNGDAWTTTPATYVSNGRYMMSERKPDELITMSKSDKYWDKQSTKVDTINFLLLKDEIAAYAAYQTDQVSFINNIPLGEMETALKSPDYIQGGLLGTYYYDFNVTKAPLDNASVRKALALAIDKNFIVTQVTKQNQIPAYAFVSDGIVDVGGKTFRGNGGDLLERDYTKAVAQAKQLLTDAGYPGGVGLPKIELSYNSNSQGHKNIAEAVANMWQTELGVTVELTPVEGTVFNSYRMQLQHMIARDGWIADWNDATSLLNLFLSTSGNNHTGWKNVTFDGMIADSSTITDPAARSQKLHDAEKLMMDEMPVAPVYYYTNNFMLKPYVKGACFSPLGNQFFWNCTVEK